MNSLMSYGSDDDLDDSPEERSMDSYGMSGRNYKKPAGERAAPQDDTNYDEVQMSLSEDSDAESKQPSKHSRDREERRYSPKSRDSRDTPQRERRDDRSERDKYTSRDRIEDRHRKDRDDDKTDRTRSRDERDDRTRSRDDDKSRDRYRDKDDDRRDRRDDRRPRSRDRYGSKDDRYRQDRDRRRSRSPRDNKDRERRRSKSPRRSRSRSRDRGGRGGFQRRFERQNRMDKIDPKDRGNNPDASQNEDALNKDRFFMPGITGRFRDQIEKRKLLWQKKEPETVTQAVAAPSHNLNAPRATKVWESTTFAQDTDGKVANKFKRLMGIKTPTEGANSTVEVLKKQDEMFSAMEQQYEVARTTTHTMRGVGLGFSSFNR